MQPITTANIDAHEADLAARIASGDLAASDLHAPKKRVALRGAAIVSAMAEAMLDHGAGCTGPDLRRLGFSQADIDRYGPAATDRANARAKLH